MVNHTTTNAAAKGIQTCDVFYSCDHTMQRTRTDVANKATTNGAIPTVATKVIFNEAI